MEKSAKALAFEVVYHPRVGSPDFVVSAERVESHHGSGRVGCKSLQLSYQIVNSLIWLGIRDMVNDVRKKMLKLRPVTYLSGSQDWGPKVDVIGFCFLDIASNYEPPESLLNWLKAGPKPIYIGFGSHLSSPTLTFALSLSACSRASENDANNCQSFRNNKTKGNY